MTGVLNTNEIDARHSPSQPADDVVVEIFIRGESQHAVYPALRRDCNRSRTPSGSNRASFSRRTCAA